MIKSAALLGGMLETLKWINSSLVVREKRWEKPEQRLEKEDIAGSGKDDGGEAGYRSMRNSD
jgi:hypothetical protein